MKRNIIFSCFIIIAILGASCQKYLDVKPKKISIIETYDQYNQLFRPVLAAISLEDMCYTTDDAYLLDDVSSFAPSVYNGLDAVARKKIYTFQKYFYEEGMYDDAFWAESYEKIYIYNVILDGVMSATEGTEKQKKALRADALLARAFAYLNLVNVYAKHYDPATASKDYAVPLKLAITEADAQPTRATVAQVYEKIAADLLEALPDLPESPENKNYTRGTKAACNAILARMYMYMGDYKKALDFVNKVLATNPVLLDYNDYKLTNTSIRFDIPKPYENPENILLRSEIMSYAGRGGDEGGCLSEDLIKLYGKDDIRKDFYFADKVSSTTFPLPVWYPNYPMNNGITTAEVMLIAAECEARIGSVQKAMDLVNKLRQHRVRKDAFVPMTATDGKDALLKVVDERRREFALIGIHRLVDLKRLNKEGVLNVTVKHVAEGVTYELKPNDKKYIFPIPKTVINFNPDMPQNDRD